MILNNKQRKLTLLFLSQWNVSENYKGLCLIWKHGFWRPILPQSSKICRTRAMPQWPGFDGARTGKSCKNRSSDYILQRPLELWPLLPKIREMCSGRKGALPKHTRIWKTPGRGLYESTLLTGLSTARGLTHTIKFEVPFKKYRYETISPIFQYHPKTLGCRMLVYYKVHGTTVTENMCGPPAVWADLMCKDKITIQTW